MIRRAPWLLVPLLLLVAACTPGDAGESPAPPAAGSPFADCATLGTSPPTAPASDRTTGDGGQPPALPAIELPCFTGGRAVAVGAIRGPAVVNLWASYCDPCRHELPAFQRLAELSGDRLHVVGVNTRDRRGAAQSIGEDFGLTFPTLFDEGGALQLELQRPVLPMTLFVDGEGRIRHVDTSGALDDAALAALVRRHLDIEVAG